MRFDLSQLLILLTFISSAKVKLFMNEILAPLISEADSISYKLLDIILTNIIEPQKTQRRSAYSLAKDLILKTSDTLVQYVQSVCENLSKSNIY